MNECIQNLVLLKLHGIGNYLKAVTEVYISSHAWYQRWRIL